MHVPPPSLAQAAIKEGDPLLSKASVGPELNSKNGVGRFVLVKKEHHEEWEKEGIDGWVGKLMKYNAKPPHFEVKFPDTRFKVRLSVAYLSSAKVVMLS